MLLVEAKSEKTRKEEWEGNDVISLIAFTSEEGQQERVSFDEEIDRRKIARRETGINSGQRTGQREREKMKLSVYGALSTGLSLSLIAHAFVTRDFHFFASCVHLTRSPASVLVLLNWALYAALLFGRLSQRLFFGELRAIEVEVCPLSMSKSRGWCEI